MFLDKEFYQVEAGITFENHEAALEHFYNIGQYLNLNPSAIVHWRWIKLTAAKPKFDARKLGAQRSDLVHPLFTPSLVKTQRGKSNLDAYVNTLTALRVKDGPFGKGLFSQIDARTAETPLPEFLKEFSFLRTNSKTFSTGFFSHSWYYFSYKDVIKANLNAFDHYLFEGWKEGRDPSPNFSTTSYLADWPSVRESRFNPLIHFLHSGSDEGRVTQLSNSVELVAKFYTTTRALETYVDFEPQLPPGFDEFIRDFRDLSALIIIPFYRRPELVEGVLGSLEQVSAELLTNRVGIICINDSPGDDLLQEKLTLWSDRLAITGVNVALFENDKNRGFIYSTNIGLLVAKTVGASAIALNSDTIVLSGSISELLRVSELDDKFAFVNPRSNNATIATYGSTHTTEWSKSYKRFEANKHLLPEFTIVPTCVGFCLFVKNIILKDFGYFDLTYGLGYNEENDLIMRANRYGFVAVIANHCFVAHLGEQSFSLIDGGRSEAELVNSSILNHRYPEFNLSIRRFFGSAEFSARRTLEFDDKTSDIMIDVSDLPGTINGTLRFVIQLLPHLLNRLTHRRVILLAPDEFTQLFDLSRFPNVSVCNGADIPNARIGLRMFQPFKGSALKRLSENCAKVGSFMLDTIALDCLHLNSDELRSIWQTLFHTCDFAVYNSKYTAEKFRNRFSVPYDFMHIASYHSLDVDDYIYSADKTKFADKKKRRKKPIVLLIGNDFCHKALIHTVQFIDTSLYDVVIFGIEADLVDVRTVPSGGLTQDQFDDLWKESDCVVFPTYYEGFGMPILETLSRNRPIVIQRNRLSEDMFERLGRPAMMVFSDGVADIDVAIANALALDRKQLSVASRPADGWDRSANEIVSGLEQLLRDRTSYDRVRARIAAIRTLHD